MTPEAADAELTPGPLKHLLHHTHPHHQGLAQAGQGSAQLQQAFAAEQPLASRTVWLLPVVGLHHIEGQQGSVPAGLQQGEVICRAQIPLEPHNLEGAHGLAQRFAGVQHPPFGLLPCKPPWGPGPCR